MVPSPASDIETTGRLISPASSSPLSGSDVSTDLLSPMAPSSTPMEALIRWDKRMSLLVFRWYNPRYSRVPLMLLEIAGHGVPWLVIPIVIYVLLPTLSPLSSSLLLNFLAVTFIDLCTIALLKPLVRRSRPTYNTGIGRITVHVVDQFSFPSGHATRAALVLSFLIQARLFHSTALHEIISSTPFLLLVSLWSILTPMSRVALGRHYILDVLGGVFIGSLYGFFWKPLWIDPDFAESLRDALRHAFFGLLNVISSLRASFVIIAKL